MQLQQVRVGVALVGVDIEAAVLESEANGRDALTRETAEGPVAFGVEPPPIGQVVARIEVRGVVGLADDAAVEQTPVTRS